MRGKKIIKSKWMNLMSKVFMYFLLHTKCVQNITFLIRGRCTAFGVIFSSTGLHNWFFILYANFIKLPVNFHPWKFSQVAISLHRWNITSHCNLRKLLCVEHFYNWILYLRILLRYLWWCWSWKLVLVLNCIDIL